MSKKVAIYLRVSTSSQTTENQRITLEGVANKAGWDIVDVYEDKALSGAKGRDQRPAFDLLCKDATQRKFDVVMAWSVDRLGRSVQDLINFFSELKALNVDIYLNQQGLDTTTPSGKAMFGMLSVFADFEREIIRERVNAGLDRARAEGKTLGRPKLSKEKHDQALRYKMDGLSIRQISKKVGISVGAVHKALQSTT
jgi:DNA invertase Pin-like site-specific DNA recombinase